MFFIKFFYASKDLPVTGEVFTIPEWSVQSACSQECVVLGTEASAAGETTALCPLAVAYATHRKHKHTHRDIHTALCYRLLSSFFKAKEFSWSVYTSGIGWIQGYDKEIIYSSTLTFVYCVDNISMPDIVLTQYFPLLLRLWSFIWPQNKSLRRIPWRIMSTIILLSLTYTL